MLRVGLSLAVLLTSFPADAQVYSRTAGAARSAASSPVLIPEGPLHSSPSLSLLLTAPALTPSLAPTALPAPSVAVSVAVPLMAEAAKPLPFAAGHIVSKAAIPSKVVGTNAAVAQSLAVSIKDVPSEAAPQAAAESFALLTGEALAPRDGSVLAAPSAPERPRLSPPSAPNQPSPETTKSVRRLMLGTAVMKSGMESVTLGMPLLALTAFGGFSAVAGLVVIYSLSQAIFAGMSGGLARRYQGRKVLAGAVAVQAALVASLIGVVAAGALSATTMIPLYLLIGGVTGIIETTRHSLPPLLLGKNEDALESYNGKLHIWYEVAGVAGALTAGALIGFAGPAWALLLQPPAYAVAAWLFWRVKHDAPAPQAPALNGPGSAVSGYFKDLKAGAKLVLGDVRLRWVALAFVLPQIVHRVFESLLIPVFAKKVLENPSASAWLLTASNMGELIGAAILLRLAARFSGPSSWIKWAALGLTLIWALALSKSLLILLPLILLSSATWSAGDLSLRSEVQGRVADRDQARATSFLYGSFVLGSALLSLGLGFLLDSMPLLQALSLVCAAFTVLAAAVYYASRRLK